MDCSKTVLINTHTHTHLESRHSRSHFCSRLLRTQKGKPGTAAAGAAGIETAGPRSQNGAADSGQRTVDSGPKEEELELELEEEEEQQRGGTDWSTAESPKKLFFNFLGVAKV